MISTNLIFDVGMSAGDDTAFYLSKGFNVVGVEADPLACEQNRLRFSDAISSGRLRILNGVASDRAGKLVTFYRNERDQGHSSSNPDHMPGDKSAFQVTTIGWPELVLHGIPYYLKIDIEGGEPEFLRSMLGSAELPTYISAECHSFTPIELLYQIGYRRFKLVNQTSFQRFALPNPALEGNYAPAKWGVSSGPFGRELPHGPWCDLAQIAVIWDMITKLRPHRAVMAPAWFDCHATTIAD